MTGHARFAPGSPECREMLERLSEYIDGELPEADARRFDSHVSDCAPCVAFVTSLRRTVALLRRTPGAVITAEQKRELMETYARLRSEGKI